jgi:hypothetical protein
LLIGTQYQLPEGMVKSQACKVEEVDVMAESNFVDATASEMSAGVHRD